MNPKMNRRTAVVAATLLLGASTASAGDPKFEDFLVQTAHKWNFTKCDSGIHKAFELVGGQDMNVLSHVLTQTKDTLKISAVWGRKGDTIYKSATIRKTSAGCITESTTMIHPEKSCAAYLQQDVPAFHVVKELLGVIFAQNTGGVDLMLTPVGSDRCIAVFENNQLL